MLQAHQDSVAASSAVQPVLKSLSLRSPESDYGKPSLWPIIERNSYACIGL